MDCLLVAENITAVGKGQFIDVYMNGSHIILSDDSIEADNVVCDLAISKNNEYLATLVASKKLTAYRLPSLEQVNFFVLPRSASKIRFGTENTHIFVADKTGDVLFYDILNVNSGVKLLGHLSFLLNVLQSPDGSYLISADRDEKIKVSCYPNTYNIQTYCLGHKEFVNYLEFLPHNDKYLLSASGDGTIKCWDYVIGHNCSTIDTKLDVKDQTLQGKFKKEMDEDGIEVENLPIIQFSTSKLNETTSLIAVTVYSSKNILLYSLKSVDVRLQQNMVQTVTLERIPGAISLFNTALFVFDSNKNVILKYDITDNESQISITEVQKIELFADKQPCIKMDFGQNIKILYKRKFDNVQEYQERKKNRLDKKT